MFQEMPLALRWCCTGPALLLACYIRICYRDAATALRNLAASCQTARTPCSRKTQQGSPLTCTRRLSCRMDSTPLAPVSLLSSECSSSREHLPRSTLPPPPPPRPPPPPLLGAPGFVLALGPSVALTPSWSLRPPCPVKHAVKLGRSKSSR